MIPTTLILDGQDIMTFLHNEANVGLGRSEHLDVNEAAQSYGLTVKDVVEIRGQWRYVGVPHERHPPITEEIGIKFGADPDFMTITGGGGWPDDWFHWHFIKHVEL